MRVMMRVTAIKKASFVATKSVQRYVSQTAPVAAAAKVDTRKELEFPRAVSKEEAPFIKPAKETGTESFMPWRGWVARLLKDKMGSEKFESMKGVFYFWPDDPNNLHQTPYPDAKTTYSKDGTQSVSYRATSPGSQPFVEIPLDGLEADPYDSGYYKRDTRRRYVDPEFPHPDVEQLKLDMQNPNDPEVQEAKKQLESGPDSSPGNKGNFATGPSDFDPTGLRAVMAVNNPELFKSLDQHMPDHVSSHITAQRTNGNRNGNKPALIFFSSFFLSIPFVFLFLRHVSNKLNCVYVYVNNTNYISSLHHRGRKTKKSFIIGTRNAIYRYQSVVILMVSARTVASQVGKILIKK
jgi:hypothetical protein